MLVSYKWLQEYFENELPASDKLAGILNTRAFEVEAVEEVDGDQTIDIDVLPNRSHDCFSHAGIAQEISTLTNEPLIETKIQEPHSDYISDVTASITTEDAKRSVMCEIQNVVVKESPDEIKQKLEVLGARSINTIVDITNIVMFELGQPMHAFDRDKIEGNTFEIRGAIKNEKVTILGDEEYELEEGMMVIADAVEALDIAGVKGGLKAELDQDTTTIILSAANFEGGHIRKTSKELNLKTDASKIFEHHISPELAKEGMFRAIDLIKKYASSDATIYSEIQDVYTDVQQEVTVEATTEELNAILGFENLTDTNVENILRRLRFEYRNVAGTFFVTPPKERLDITIKEELAEEIGRVFGYDTLPEREITTIDRRPDINPEHAFLISIRNVLTGAGYSEIMTSSFVSEGDIKMTKSFADDRPYLRTSLIPGMEKSLEMNVYNADLLGLQFIKTFEIGKKFTKKGETLMLCIGVGNNKIKKPSPANQIREAIETLSEKLDLDIKATVSDTEAAIEIDLDRLLEKFETPESYESYSEIDSEIKFKAYSQYPFVLRDLSMWVSGSVGQGDDLISHIKEKAGELLVNTTLFDVYEKTDEGKTSYAFRLVFQSAERTLTDEEINPIMETVTGYFNDQDGFEVR